MSATQAYRLADPRHSSGAARFSGTAVIGASRIAEAVARRSLAEICAKQSSDTVVGPFGSTGFGFNLATSENTNAEPLDIGGTLHMFVTAVEVRKFVTGIENRASLTKLCAEVFGDVDIQQIGRIRSIEGCVFIAAQQGVATESEPLGFADFRRRLGTTGTPEQTSEQYIDD